MTAKLSSELEQRIQWEIPYWLIAEVRALCLAAQAEARERLTGAVVESYRVEPEPEGEGGDWHVLVFADGRQRHILTRHPCVEVEPEKH